MKKKVPIELKMEALKMLESADLREGRRARSCRLPQKHLRRSNKRQDYLHISSKESTFAHS